MPMIPIINTDDDYQSMPMMTTINAIDDSLIYILILSLSYTLTITARLPAHPNKKRNSSFHSASVCIIFVPDMREFIIADNQDITKAGMMFLLSKQKDTALLLEADNKGELVQQLRLHPQAVVVLDYTLFDFSGADELIVLHERFKEADWLLFSDELSVEFLRQVLFSSMSFGVVLKDNSKEEILSALQCASRKERFICNHVSNLLLSGSNASPARPALKDDLLTPAERSVLKEIALGKTTKEIAAEKNLSFHTVNSHRKNIFRKLGVNNAHEATKYAMKAGIVDLVEYYI